MTNNMIDIVSDYEYVIGQVQGNVLNLQAQFGGMGWLREELYIIAKELENTGKMFAEKQGLRETGTLIDSTHAVVDDNQHINFFNNANLGRGFYAGHIEYGHHTRDGQFVPARPFMRPALYAVAEASKGKLQGALSRYLNQVVYGRMSLNTLEFGRAHSTSNYTRVFYQQQTLGRGASTNTGHYTATGLQNSGMNRQGVFGQLASTGHRGVMSPIVADRDSRGRVIQMGNADRFMTQNPTYSRSGTASTRRYQYYGTEPGRVGRPPEGKARVSSGKGPGRTRIYPPGKQPSRQPTGNPRGRPRIYPPGMQPSRQPTGNPRGRPKIYSDKSQWPSRQPTGKPRGRPSKPKVQGPKRRRGQRGKGKKTAKEHTKKRVMANERIKSSGISSEYDKEFYNSPIHGKYVDQRKARDTWGNMGFTKELKPEVAVPDNYATIGAKVAKKRGKK